MRNLFMIGMLITGAFMAGWFKIQRDGERTTIEINRNEIRSDARQAIDRGREFLDRHDLQYAEPQSADQQYADPRQPYSDPFQQQRPFWPQEQVANQQDPRGAIYDPRQPPIDPIYYPQDQRFPNRAVDPQPGIPYLPQPYNQPFTR